MSPTHAVAPSHDMKKVVAFPNPPKIKDTVQKSTRPIIFISEDIAGKDPELINTIMREVKNAPLCFENSTAFDKFVRNGQSDFASVDAITIGTCELNTDENASTAVEFILSDCIIVLGTLKPKTKEELTALKDKDRALFFEETACKRRITAIGEMTQHAFAHQTAEWLMQLRLPNSRTHAATTSHALNRRSLV